MIPIFKPYMPENITSGIEDILYSGKLSYGDKGKEFEEKLASYIGNDKVFIKLDCKNLLLIPYHFQYRMIIFPQILFLSLRTISYQNKEYPQFPMLYFLACKV